MKYFELTWGNADDAPNLCLHAQDETDALSRAEAFYAKHPEADFPGRKTLPVRVQPALSHSNTIFLNVDLDIRGDAADVQILLSSARSSIVVLMHEDCDASLELAEQLATPEATLQEFVKLVEMLPNEARAAWDRLEYRRADIGIQAGNDCQAPSFTSAVSTKTLMMIANVSLELAFTVYAPRPK
ncbi:hypothetical protein HAP47_0017930 [Bradyrhizobium sp. 41S5]|uniref:hypothetical protein n=1 Tax=Bradyrhizobium sp. 41S5 TaxID=1404443 RepID=UPI0015950D1C|nr:hypothetical protein [Bradyrhizobium sp. 41S5]UFX48429.1 hypothetical protein HAP47_0017930 [Bradyrhizobium sp. 41S5]